jgi:hypothetical protein
MPEMLRPFIDEARERQKRRPASPGVAVESIDERRWTLGSPHREFEAWEVQICDAFGTRSGATYWTFLNQLAALCGQGWDEERRNWVPDETELNAALNIVNGIRPRNEIEAALAAQMVAVHFLQMKTTAYALRQTGLLNFAAVAGKLARTFAMQCDSLSRLRGKTGKQVIKVRYERHDHKHVHLREGGAENETQARAPARALTGRTAKTRPALQGPDETRDRVSGTGGEGKVSLPNARRR